MGNVNVGSLVKLLSWQFKFSTSQDNQMYDAVINTLIERSLLLMSDGRSDLLSYALLLQLLNLLKGTKSSTEILWLDYCSVPNKEK